MESNFFVALLDKQSHFARATTTKNNKTTLYLHLNLQQFYNNIFKIPKIKWRPPVVTMRASWEQVACIEEELQRLLVRIGKNSISGYIVLQAEL